MTAHGFRAADRWVGAGSLEIEKTGQVADGPGAMRLGDAQGGLGRARRGGALQRVDPVGEQAEILDGHQKIRIEGRRQDREGGVIRFVLRQTVAVERLERRLGYECPFDPVGRAGEKLARADHREAGGGRRPILDGPHHGPVRKGQAVIDARERRQSLPGPQPLAGGQGRHHSPRRPGLAEHGVDQAAEGPARAPLLTEIRAGSVIRGAKPAHSRSSPKVVRERAG